jgi:rhodanese-related sulfurtransferase
VDVRTPEEFEYLGHIPQAKLIPLYELPYAFRMLDPEKEIAITCQHGVRSLDACYFLQSQGFEKLYNLQEGMSTWTGEVVRDVTGMNRLVNLESPMENHENVSE